MFQQYLLKELSFSGFKERFGILLPALLEEGWRKEGTQRDRALRKWLVR